MNIGKGGNCIISLIHHFLQQHNFGEAHLRLHADNCSGQNKNRSVYTLAPGDITALPFFEQICNAVFGVEGYEWPQ